MILNEQPISSMAAEASVPTPRFANALRDNGRQSPKKNQTVKFKLGQPDKSELFENTEGKKQLKRSKGFLGSNRKFITFEVSNSAFYNISQVGSLDAETGCLELPDEVKQSTLRHLLQELADYTRLEEAYAEAEEDFDSQTVDGRTINGQDEVWSDTGLDVPDENFSRGMSDSLVGRLSRRTVIRRVGRTINEESDHAEEEEHESQEDEDGIKPALGSFIEEQKDRQDQEEVEEVDDAASAVPERMSTHVGNTTQSQRSELLRNSRLMFSETEDVVNHYEKNVFSTWHDTPAREPTYVKQVFAMDGEFVIAVTREKKKFDYFLELYRYNQKEPLDQQRIFFSGYSLEIDYSFGLQRRYAILIFTDVLRKDQSLKSQEIVVLDSHLFTITSANLNNSSFSITGQSGPGQGSSNESTNGFSIAHGLRKITFDDEYMQLMKGRVWSIHSRFIAGKDSQPNGEPTGIEDDHLFYVSMQSCINRWSTSKSAIDRGSMRKTLKGGKFETIMFRFSPKKLFTDDFVSQTDKNNLTVFLASESKVLDKCNQHKFLKKKLLGMYNIWPNKMTAIYRPGILETESDDRLKFDPQLKDSIVLKPFSKARTCHMTRFGNIGTGGQPILLFSNNWQANQIITAYKLERRAWRDILHVSDPNFRLTRSFGRILYMTSIKEQKNKLLEIGGKNNSEVVTEMKLSEGALDACNEHTSYLLQYQANSTNFTWQRFKSQVFKLCSPRRHIVQLCKPYKVTYEQDSRCFTMAKSEYEKITIKLPAKLMQVQIETFYPVLSPNKSIMLLALRFLNQQRNNYETDKYHSLIIADLETNESSIVNFAGFYVKLWFESESDVLIQQQGRVVRLKLLVKEDRSHVIDSKEEDQLDEVNSSDLGSPSMRVSSYLNGNDILMPPRDYEKRHIFAVQFNKVWLIDAEAAKIICLPTQRPFNCNRFDCKLSCSHDFSDIQDMAKLTKPEQSYQNANFCSITNGTNENSLERWYACFSQDGLRVYAVFANASPICWLTWFDLSDDQKTLEPSTSLPILVPKGKCVGIQALNPEQVFIQDEHGFTVVNVKHERIDFKRVTKETMCCDPTIVDGCLSIPRALFGHIMNFQNKSFDQKFEFDTSDSFINWISIRTRNLNEYRQQMEAVYEERFPGFYLSMDETDYEAQQLSRTLIFYVKVMLPDYILINQQDGDDKGPRGFVLCRGTESYPREGNSGGLLPIGSEFKETILLRLESSNNDSIWDRVIQNGLRNGEVKIDDNQLLRVTMANVDDKNQNMLHYWARDSKTKLRELFMKTSIAVRDNLSSKRFPFFLNFEGKSPLCYVLDKNDSAQFQDLLGLIIQVQGSFESGHLIDNVLIKAMQSDLDLQLLFRSKICTSFVCRDQYDHFDCFPEFHENAKTTGAVFKGCWVELLNSETVVKDTFGEKFALAVADPQSPVQKQDNLSPIWYTVDGFMTSQICGKTASRQFIQALSQTKNIEVFNTGFIQRFINQQWAGGLIWFFVVNLLLFGVVYVLLIANSILIDYEKGTTQAKARLICSCIGSIIILIIVGFFELRQALAEKWRYFCSLDNFNDIFFFFAYWAYFYCELQYGSTREDSEEYEATRILLSLLIVSGFVKLMSLNRVNANLSFILRMIVTVSYTIMPFLELFMFLIVVFAFVVHTLGLRFDSMDDENPYEDISILSYFFFLFRTSMGDFEVEQFKELSLPLQLTLWLFWTMLVLLNTIVFLNFLIAVINDAYSQVMETRTEEIYKKKAQVLVDIQNILGDYGCPEPTRIQITRSSELDQTSDSWNGVLAEIKKVLSSKLLSVEYGIETQMQIVSRQLKDQHYRTETTLQKLDRRLQMSQKKFEQSNFGND